MSQLQLSGQQPIAQGRQRHVYLHPSDPGKLVKVLKPRDALEPLWTFRSLTDRLLPAARFRQIRKEHQEAQRIHARAVESQETSPLARVYSIVETDMGRASITDRVTTDTGRLGETLSARIKARSLDQADLDLLNDMIRRLFLLNARASDLNMGNIVFGHRHRDGQLGPRECVLVDGYGDIHAIPLRSMSGAFNQKKLRDRLERLASATNLRLDNATRTLVQTPSG